MGRGKDSLDRQVSLVPASMCLPTQPEDPVKATALALASHIQDNFALSVVVVANCF